jgi:phosphoribosylanthranilate isomerase
VIQIKASGITHLTDARYFAAKGVTWMGYCLDPASDQFIAPVKMQAIREWVDGVLTVGEMGFVSGDELLDAVASYRLDAVQVNMWVEAAELEALQGRADILREVVVQPDSDAAELQQEIRRMEHLTTATVLSFAPHGITWADIQEGRPFGPDALRQLCSVGPVLLDLDVAAADMPELLTAVQPYGWVARGGEEERVGVKSYDDLDEIFEAL